MPRISVLMSAYNQEKFISDCLDSILSQTFRDFEVIIINDGSKDKTVEIIEEYSIRDNRVKLYNNDGNKGLIYSLNRGLGLCLDSEYIARMDTDDICLDNRFEKQIEFLDYHKDVGILGTGVSFFGNNVKNRLKYPPVSHQQLVSTLICQNPFYHPTMMFRTQIFKDNHIQYDYQFPKYEDYAMWVDMIDKCKLANLREVLLKYRRHESNEGSIYNSNPSLDAIMFNKVVSRLFDKLGVSYTEEQMRVLSIITSKTRTQLDTNLDINVIQDLRSFILSSVPNHIDKQYLDFKLFERILLYLLSSNRYAEIVTIMTGVNSSLRNLYKLIVAQYTRKD